MYKNLSPGVVGIQNLSIPDTIAMAREHGFAGIDVNIDALDKLVAEEGLARCAARFSEAGIRASHWVLPNDWKQSPEQWSRLLGRLDRLAELSVALGCRRCCTYFAPASDQRPYVENFAWHAERLRPVAHILSAHGIAFGMEFLGPMRLRQGRRYPFIYSLGGMLELARALDAPGVGLLLDAWHLYTSGGSIADLAVLKPGDVVNVHVNDAPAGVAMEDFQDDQRCLPMETGIIDTPGLLAALARIDYAGPITAEPFSQRLNAVGARSADAAATEVAASLDAMWDRAGVTSA
ncbi:MAG: sugar phosphate isomerase/epimerase [Planctomycetota bacterium]|jgi:sugar phosphate isomerase/epimerase|nr:sugar phosphate isomerase/epimerase [Planctomycetota bacterium]